MSRYAKYSDYVLTGRVASAGGGGGGGGHASGEGAAGRQVGGQLLRPPQPPSAAGCGCARSLARAAEHQCSSSNKPAQREPSRPSSELSRTSLLGRPLKVETHYRDLRYRKKQNIIYNFLERPRGWRAALYHFAL